MTIFGIDVLTAIAGAVLAVFLMSGWSGVKALWGRFVPAKKG